MIPQKDLSVLQFLNFVGQMTRDNGLSFFDNPDPILLFIVLYFVLQHSACIPIRLMSSVPRINIYPFICTFYSSFYSLSCISYSNIPAAFPADRCLVLPKIFPSYGAGLLLLNHQMDNLPHSMSSCYKCLKR